MPPLYLAVNEVRMMMRGYLGVKDTKKTIGDSDLSQLLADFGMAGIEVKNG